jgi:hypothetical protein
MTYVVVGEAVIDSPPVTARSIESHRSVTFLNHPFACSSSTRPRGLYGNPLAGGAVGAAVSAVLV